MASGNNESTLQERLSEELGLLPGRIARTFYLLATLDAQASYVNNNLQHARCQLLDSLHQSSSAAAPAAALQQLSASHQLHQVQRQLLADKLFVDRKASEWLARAKHVVSRYRKEAHRRSRSSSSGGPGGQLILSTDDPRSAAAAAVVESSRHRKRMTLSTGAGLLDEDQDCVSPYGPYGLKGLSGESSSSVAGQPKRGRVSAGGDFAVPGGGRAPGRRPNINSSSSLLSAEGSNNRRRQQSSASHHHHHHHHGNRVVHGVVESTTASSFSKLSGTTSQLASGATFTIKLGSSSSQQRGGVGRGGGEGGEGGEVGLVGGALATTNQARETVTFLNGTGAIPDQSESLPVMNDIEEYFCPVCNKSDFEDPSMVACDGCDKWYHCSCVGFQNLADAQSSTNFYCQQCVDSKTMDAAVPSDIPSDVPSDVPSDDTTRAVPPAVTPAVPLTM